METVNKNNLPQAIKDIPADEFQPLNTSTLKERERIAKEKIQMEKEISRLEGKLSNQGFLAKAPEAVVAKEKEKLEEYKQKQQALLEREAFLETL